MCEITSISELENCNVVIDIVGEKYNSIIIKEENNYSLKIDVLNNLDAWRGKECRFSTITGKLAFDNSEVTFINCLSIGSSYTHTSDGAIEKAFNTLHVDRILVGYSLNEIDNLSFKEVSADYTHLTDFFRYLPYKDNLENIELHYDCKIYTSCSPTHKMVFYPSVIHKEKSLIINSKITISIIQEANFETCIQSIYKFSKLLMIFNKQYDEPKNIKVLCSDNNTYPIIDCISPNENLKKNVFPYRGIKHQHFNDFGEIINSFIKIENRLDPVLDLYFESISSNCTSLMRFLNVINMVEYFSNEFDEKNCKNAWRGRNPGCRLPKNGPTLVSKIESLIKNINAVYKFKDDDIFSLSNRIKQGRIYFVHYTQNSVKLSEREVFIFYNFLEDVILLNIYIQLGIDLEDYLKKNVLLQSGIYNTEELINFIEEHK